MKQRSVTFLLALVMLAFLAGCGGGGGSSSAKNTKHESQVCIGCHEGSSWKTPGSGQPIVTEWLASTHNTKNGASCQDCHGSGYMHPTSCNKCHSVGLAAVNPILNPDADGKCAGCHQDKLYGFNSPFTDSHGSVINSSSTIVSPSVVAGAGAVSVTYNAAPTTLFNTGVPLGVRAGSTTSFVHFSTGKRANYVSKNYEHKCRSCHNPHDTSFGREQRKMWAESGHGNTRGLAYIAIDGKTLGTTTPLNLNTGNASYCVRCHTSTGFINFVANDNFTNVNALPNTDTSREATNCNVCHTDNDSDSSSYSGKLRKVALDTTDGKVPGVPIYYPYSTPGFKTVTLVKYDSLGSSNLCVTCHSSGRGAVAKTITDDIDSSKGSYLRDLIVADRKPSAPSSHTFTGAEVLQGEKSAFLYYSDPLKYKYSTLHRSINIDGNGPCIGCHMPRVQSSQTGGTIHSHLFRPVTWQNDDINDSIIEPFISNATVCSSCHNGVTELNPATMNSKRKGYRASLAILNKLIVSTTSKDWIGPNPATGITTNAASVALKGNLPAGVYTMGATYNYGMLSNDPSAYAHSPILARQLIYDSIDWLIHGTAAGFGSVASPTDIYNKIVSNAAAPVGVVLTGSTWAKKNPVKGAITASTANDTYVTFTNADKEDALKWLCFGYVSGVSTTCERWN